MNLLVIGSINMDIVIRSTRMPAAGETVFGDSLAYFPGGKGANQAVAAARLGAAVSMIGALGEDESGQRLRAHLQAEGIDTDGIAALPAHASGTAHITVCDGENRIIVLPGANFSLRVEDIDRQRARFQHADVVLSQLEIPLPCVQRAAEIAAEYGKPFILNPAPAIALPPALRRLCALLTPNEHEWRQLSAAPMPPNMLDDSLETDNILVTCGTNGVYYRHGGKLRHQTVFDVAVTDTTGAGDTFNGALAAFWDKGLPAAVRLAAAAAALSVTRAGAQSGMPTSAELAAFLHTANHHQ